MLGKKACGSEPSPSFLSSFWGGAVTISRLFWGTQKQDTSLASKKQISAVQLGFSPSKMPLSQSFAAAGLLTAQSSRPIKLVCTIV